MYYSLAEWRVKATLVEALGADDAKEEDTSGAVTHVARLHLGLVHQTLPAIPVTLRDIRQLRL